MLFAIARSVTTVLLPAGLALLLCTETAHAQRARFGQQGGGRQQGFRQMGQNGQMGSCPGMTGNTTGTTTGTTGTTTTPSTTSSSTSTTAAAARLAALQQQRALLAMQAQLNAQAYQQQRFVARQYAVVQLANDLQLLGLPPDIAYQTARRQMGSR